MNLLMASVFNFLAAFGNLYLCSSLFNTTLGLINLFVGVVCLITWYLDEE